MIIFAIKWLQLKFINVSYEKMENQLIRILKGINGFTEIDRHGMTLNFFYMQMNILYRVDSCLEKYEIKFGVWKSPKFCLVSEFFFGNHQVLLKYPENSGIIETRLQLVTAYMKNRGQRVQMNDIFSNPLPILCGVPQRTVLGPVSTYVVTLQV